MGFAIWLDDEIRYKLFGEERPNSNPFYNYWLLITGQ